jgi:hypothetical protein
MKDVKKNVLLSIIFLIIGLVSLSLNFTKLEGSSSHFTFFEFVAPSVAGILPLGVAMILVVVAKALFSLLTNSLVFNLFDVARLFLPLAAVSYFYKKSKFNLIIPVIAIIGFNLHPVGRQAWVFSLLWLIPIAMHLLRDKFLLARSIGATFSQHALGGLLFIYMFPATPEFWIGLIPIVLQERLVFAIGISAFYIFFKELFELLSKKNIIKFERIQKFYNGK